MKKTLQKMWSKSTSKSLSKSPREDNDTANAAADADICCGICSRSLARFSPAQVLPCSHVYHRDCVEKLQSLGITQPCSLCRVAVKGPQKVHDDAIRRWMVLSGRYDQGRDKPWRPITRDDDRRELDAIMVLLQRAGDKGVLRAQLNVAHMMEHGKGAPKDILKALDWYRKAADQDHAEAQLKLGLICVEGKVTPNIERDAVVWFRKAADQGLARAQYNLGAMYAIGKGVGRDHIEALSWFRKAEAQGFEKASAAIKKIGHFQATGQTTSSQATGEATSSRRNAMPAMALSIGTKVMLQHLQAQPELNGQRGVVMGLSRSSGRCSVLLRDGRGPYSIKPENLLEVDAEKMSDAAVKLFEEVDKKHESFVASRYHAAPDSFSEL